MDYSTFSQKLVQWYNINKRDLPWRNTKSPYKIWLSEIILQQTRVNQGLPYYEEFINKYADIHQLANAPEDSVLRTWQGLGYYSRARNLQKCAKIISREYQGKFPQKYEELCKLPGIGPYTASAISSIAFDRPHAVVDGNVERVVSRVEGIKDNIADAGVKKKIQKFADEMLYQEQPGMYNQAIMELGATVCTPKNPACDSCPVNEFCYAYSHNLQASIPKKIKKLKRKSRYFYYWVIKQNEKIALVKRDNKNIWRGLYEFYLVEKPAKVNPEEALDNHLQTALGNNAEILDIYTAKKHVLTHQDIYSFYIVISVNSEVAKKLGLNFYLMDEMMELPKPILIDKFLSEKII